MDERDDELERLLSPLRGIEASELELARWRRALRGAYVPLRRRWAELTAAVVVGFLVGGLVFREAPPSEERPSATIVSVHAKAE